MDVRTPGICSTPFTHGDMSCDSMRRRAGALPARTALRPTTLCCDHRAGAARVPAVLCAIPRLEPCTIPHPAVCSNICSLGHLHGVCPCERHVLFTPGTASAGPLAGTQYVILVFHLDPRSCIELCDKASLRLPTRPFTLSPSMPPCAAPTSPACPSLSDHRRSRSSLYCLSSSRPD